MRCPVCTHDDTKVLESRISHEGRAVRRRRSCLSCGHRFTTYEKEEGFVFQIRKRDGRVEGYDREKVTRVLLLACQKRPVTIDQVDTLVIKVEKAIQTEGQRTIDSRKLGDLIMEQLVDLDHVAYVRFASIYKDFKDPSEFVKELQSLDI